MPFCIHCGHQLSDEAAFCPECGERISLSDCDIAYKVCKKCGASMPVDMLYCLNCGMQFENDVEDFETIQTRVRMQFGVWKNKWVALLLCIFFGWLGVHRFYDRKTITGVLYLCTLGCFGIGWLVDIVRIVCKPNPYRA